MIELKNIIKNYEASETVVHALKGVSLAFRENEFVAILGPSGGGKTTLLNIMGGLDKYTSGDLIINGKSTIKYRDKDWDTYRNHSVGFVFQSYNLIPHQTVLSNVELALTIAGVGKNEREERAIEVLEKVGLADQIYKKPNQLSGGQMQRVAIARALINDPDILLADEPTGALDSKTSLQIMDLLKEVAKDKLVVMVTHNPDLAYQYANRIVKISDGEIIDDSNPYIEEKTNRKNKTGKAKMHFTTALALSLQNLWTKKARTFLVGFAGSIGIIGIALILSLSTGVNNYIDEVQENSLSSYPLTIENNTVDFTSAMTAMMGTIEARQKIDGSIVEVPVMTEMFASVDIGENNLKKFKEYLERNEELLKEWVSSIQYTYGIDFNIYKADNHLKVNPSELMSSGMMSYYSAYSFSNTFFEVLDNSDLLDTQYEILAGRWSNNYDEVILVLADKYAISDFTLYSLGLKDQDEFNELISAAMKGETSTIESHPLTLSYEELLDLEYKLVLSTSYYVHDETYDAWVDKSSDEAFVNDLIDNGLSLKIVGVVAPKEGVSSTALTQGIGYSHALVEWAINQASQTDIVKQQLSNKDIDVFSGNSFEDINNKQTESKLNFQDMISIDEKKLMQAFGNNFDQKKISNIITKYISEAMSAIQINNEELSTDLLADISSESLDMVIDYIQTYGNGITAYYVESDIDSMISNYLGNFDYDTIINKYGINKMMLEPFYTEMFKGLLSGYYQYASVLDINLKRAMVSKSGFSAFVALFISNDEVTNAIDLYAKTVVEATMKEKVGLAMGNMSTGIIQQVSNGMNVNPELIASAFTFNMNENDLTALMSTLNTTNTMASCASNLKKLGYRDLQDPSSISIYLFDFESKDNFKAFIDEYNNIQRESDLEEDVISYTDITGILMSSIQTIINAVSYVLIAFVSVSLIVSSIMIGIITYISVIERTKEIGVLRSLGASKKDVGNIFSAETFIIGLLAGLIGVFTTIILCIPINIVIRKLTSIATLKAELPLFGAIGLVIISVILTLIAGIFPSSKASKCDPVIALRSE